MPTEALDPNFYHAPQTFGYFRWPPRPLSVTGFVFDPVAGTFDFSAVPGFDLSRLQSLWHAPTRTSLFARPISRPFDLAAVDGVPVPTSGRLLKVKAETSGMSAGDEVIAFYDS